MKRFAIGAVIAAAVIPASAIAARFHRPLPRVSGEVQVRGAHAPIEVLRDRYGVPHIRAASRADALFGLGFVHAQDRLWQMEMQRRAAAGRLAEVLGDAAVPTDRFTRTIGFARAARSAREQFAFPETRAAIDAYVAGINAFLEQTKGWKLPVEFTLAGFTPEPWTADDVFGTVKLIAWAQGMNWREDLMRMRLAARLGAEAAADLAPAEFGGGTILPPVPLTAPGSPAPLDDLARMLERAAPAADGASNSWVLSPARTATGRPMLANDPHIASQAPASWYLVHLTGGSLDVIGASFPGAPAVVIGHNAHVAWGITNAMADAQDLIPVRHDQITSTLDEIIKVKDGDDVRLHVRISSDGPIVSDLVDERELLLALKWTGLDARDSSVHALSSAGDARNAQELTTALQLLHAPVLSIVYADVSGEIGYVAAGSVPARAEGASATPGWQATVPAQQTASATSPAGGFIVTANNAIGGGTSFSTSFDLSYRADRITAMIEEEGTLAIEDVARMQQDVTSRQVAALAPWLFTRVSPRDHRAAAAIHRLRAWNGALERGSADAALYKRYYAEATEAIFSDDLGPMWGDYRGSAASMSRAMHRLAANPQRAERWCDNVDRPGTQSCAETLGAALTRAIDSLEREQGTNHGAWRWDRVNVVRFPHAPLDAVGMLKPIFSRELKRPGDGFTVNPAMRIREQTLVASYRQIVDVGDWDKSLFVIPLGQSGHPLSAHYDDMLPLWDAGAYVPMSFSEGAVRAAAWHRLVLRP